MNTENKTLIINNIVNSFLGVILITIIPTVLFYYGITKDYANQIQNNKMEILISILFGYMFFSFFKVLDLKNKIISLKKYRDFEIISIVDFYNSEIKKLNDRLLETEKKLNIESTSELNENEKRLFNIEKTTKEDKILEYNKNFDSWKCGDYGIKNQTYYSDINYQQKKP